MTKDTVLTYKFQNPYKTVKLPFSVMVF